MDFENIYYTCRENPEKFDRKMGKYISKSYRTEGVSDIAHAVKSDNPDLLKKWIAINRIAKHIIDQNILTSKDYIVPAPQHTGRAEYTLEIAKIISKETGCKIADILGCKPRDTLYNLKKKNGEKSIEDSGLYLLTDKFPKYNIWFLDNVIATGKTFEDVRKLIPHLKPLIYSISPRLKMKTKNRKQYFIREGLFKKKKKNIREIIIQEDYKITFIEKCRALFYELKSQGYDVGPNDSFWAMIGKTYDQINFDNEKDEDGCYYCKFIIDEDEKTVGRDYTRPREPKPFTPYKIGFSDEDDGLVGFSESLKESKLEEGPLPKWKQKILDDLNALSEEIENNYTGYYWNNEKLKGLSLEDILSIVKKANKKFGFSELQEKHVAIEVWKGIHDDEIGISYWASDEEKEEFYAHKFKQEMLDKCKELNHKLNKEIWPALESEYQSKYGRKRNPQPYIKDPTDASEIFDKVSALKYESKKIAQKRIVESFEDKINALTSKIEEYKELCGNVWAPQAWKAAYSKVPEGLKLTIDTDEWFDKENPLGHLIDFILDIYDSDYDSSVRELTGINIYSDVDFLGGEKSGYATYLIKNNESNNLKESRTYFGDEIKEVVDWLIESPYNNWQEEDREYLMNCDNEKLFKYESDTFDLECEERSLYESRIIESFERVLNEI
jgi:predicted amidophosphoribosyltransferase